MKGLIYFAFVVQLSNTCTTVDDSSEEEDFTQLTQICVFNDSVKKSLKSNENNTASDTNFYKTILSSDTFVDKSLLTKALFGENNPKNLCLVCLPRKWGKSMNLDMIKFFFQMEVDENGQKIPPENTKAYKFFINGTVYDKELGKTRKLNSPLKISTLVDFNQQYLANRSVIKLYLSSLAINDLDEFYRDFGKQIRLAFEEHGYLEKLLTGTDLAEFQRYKNGTKCDRYSLESSLSFLTNILDTHFGEVFILVDEYDDVFNGIFFQDAETRPHHSHILDFMNSFYETTFKNSSQYSKAMLTGIVPHVGKNGGWNIVKEYSIFEMRGISPFYGLTRHEVCELIEKSPNKVNFSIDDVIKWYGGYRASDDMEKPMFNTGSVVKAVNANELANHCTDPVDSESFIPNLARYFQIQQKLQSLIYNPHSTYLLDTSRLKLTYESLLELRNFINAEQPAAIEFMSKEYFVSLLYWFGFLTATESHSEKPTWHLNTAVPNIEMRSKLEKFIDSAFSSTLGSNYTCVKNAADSLYAYLRHGSEQSKMVEDFNYLFSAEGPFKGYKSMFEKWDRRKDLTPEGYSTINEAAVQAIVSSVFLTMQVSRQCSVSCEFHYDIKQTKLGKRTDIFFATQECHGVVMSSFAGNLKKFNISDAKAQADRDTLLHYGQQQTFKTMKYIMVVVGSRNKVLVECWTDTIRSADGKKAS